ncbi:MAG: calcium-binding protein [Novosphingobium sp.]|uniref:calcium-binding protein n=1 Tax=Novosphingobium sp. TaxID=1874826 RepID=UPI00301807DD
MADFSGGAGKDTYTGTADGDLISGGGGADTLDGGAGDDAIASADRAPGFGAYFSNAISLDTGTERDTLNGGDGDDTLFAGYGDNVDGGGINYRGNTLKISFLGASAGITVDFSQEVIKIGGGTIQNIQNLSWVQGTNYDDTIIAVDRSTGYSGFNTVLGMGGNDHITAGYYTQSIDGGDGDDTIDAHLSVYLQTVRGGSGNDTIDSTGNHSAVTYGDDGNDTIRASFETHGGAGDDHLFFVLASGARGYTFGDAGNDTIEAVDNAPLAAFGGEGSDTLIGGSGDDTLATGPQPDLILQPIYDDTGSEHDTVLAGGGADLIAAGIGDDVEGGEGTDTLRLSLMGAGHAVTLSTEGILSGAGPLYGGGTIKNVEILQYLGLSDFADSIDLAASGLPQTLDAGGGNDVITSHGLALAVLGGAGDDRLNGGNAAGFFDGGDGTDTADYGTATRKVVVQLVASNPGGTIGGKGLLANVEIVNGSAFADKITGDAGNNVLNGMGGNDYLAGGAGSDTLYGGAGIDKLVGGAGDDTYIVDDLLDTLVEAGSGGTDTVRAGIDFTLTSALENLVLTGAAAINGTGNAKANVITGNDAANTLLGLGGNDVLIGGKGQDTLDGGAGGDVYIVAALEEEAQAEIHDTGTSGIDELRFAAATGTYKALVGDIGIERIVAGTGTAAAADTSGTGTVGLDASALGRAITLVGNAGANVLTGTRYSDRLDGGAGADTLTGGKGNDTYVVDNAGDKITENTGEGRDTVVASVSWTLGANLENLTLTGSTDINATGNAANNVITGNDGANVLIGGGGTDTLAGGRGNDIYMVDGAGTTVTEGVDAGLDKVITTVDLTLGANVEIGVAKGSGAVAITGGASDNLLGGNGAGNLLDGGDGNDSLLGQLGNDTLKGGVGNDFLYGGAGIDSLTGGAGSDQFVVSTYSGEGVDRITDFVSGTDTLLVVNAYVSGYLLAAGFVYGTSAHDADDIAIYDQSTGNLYVDYDGNGPQGKVLLASFTPGTALAAADLILIEGTSFAQQIGELQMALMI